MALPAMESATAANNGHSLQDIKKSRRTVILGGAGLPLPGTGDAGVEPLTPPLSERDSDDVADLYIPEAEEHFESVDLSSDEEWSNQPDTASIAESTQVTPCSTRAYNRD
jgi:hypothetical protein